MAASTVSNFLSRLRGPLGRNDTEGDGFITQGLNFACLLVALLYDPPELQTTGSLTISAGTSSVSLSTLTRLRLIKAIYNTTGSCVVWPMSFQHWFLHKPAGIGYAEYYTRDGNTLYVSKAMLFSSQVLTVYYNQFPIVVSGVADSISFETYDPLVESYALAYAMACLEETEQATFWNKLADVLNIPEAILLQVRQKIEGGPYRGGNTV